MRHFNHVLSLKKKLYDYGVTPFEDAAAKCIITGIEIDESIRKDIVLAPIIGEKCFYHLSMIGSEIRVPAFPPYY